MKFPSKLRNLLHFVATDLVVAARQVQFGQNFDDEYLIGAMIALANRVISPKKLEFLVCCERQWQGLFDAVVPSALIEWR